MRKRMNLGRPNQKRSSPSCTTGAPLTTAPLSWMLSPIFVIITSSFVPTKSITYKIHKKKKKKKHIIFHLLCNNPKLEWVQVFFFFSGCLQLMGEMVAINKNSILSKYRKKHLLVGTKTIHTKFGLRNENWHKIMGSGCILVKNKSHTLLQVQIRLGPYSKLRILPKFVNSLMSKK